MVIHAAREAWVTARYLDVGAVVCHLRMIPWQAPGFDAALHRPQSERIHDHMLTEGGFSERNQPFLVRAQKPRA